MNYKRIHDLIINRAINRPIPIGYTEKHHIIPKSLGGGNEPENIVILTGREHYIIHKLLYKIYKNKSMQAAFAIMALTSRNRNYRVTSHDYSLGKELASLAKTGVKMPEETKLKISKTLTGVKKHSNKNYIKPKLKSHIENIRKSKIGAKNPMYGTVSPTRNIPHTKETKDLISEKTKKGTEYPPCPHCGTKTNKGNAIRWHYDNCKLKGQ
ncbi:homing endonuclease [Proteus phage phiP4-3]|uniref:Putative homing endonuclease n=1 Tax=Proteus phage phiP4-3 TaxID=2065203 RepID=A0A2I6PF97_9CAUD|nr:homing endonuclease [Proteus phage phiP4-3]AUM58396.1 putative homing endonuclease [Proteus phage phiP4-3]